MGPSLRIVSAVWRRNCVWRSIDSLEREVEDCVTLLFGGRILVSLSGQEFLFFPAEFFSLKTFSSYSSTCLPQIRTEST